MKEELKIYDIHLFLAENQGLKDQLENVQAKLSIVQCDFQSSKRAYEKAKEDYEKVEKELEELSKKTEFTQNQAAQEKLSKEKKEGEKNLLFFSFKFHDPSCFIKKFSSLFRFST